MAKSVLGVPPKNTYTYSYINTQNTSIHTLKQNTTAKQKSTTD